MDRLLRKILLSLIDVRFYARFVRVRPCRRFVARRGGVYILLFLIRELEQTVEDLYVLSFLHSSEQLGKPHWCVSHACTTLVGVFSSPPKHIFPTLSSCPFPPQTRPTRRHSSSCIASSSQYCSSDADTDSFLQQFLTTNSQSPVDRTEFLDFLRKYLDRKRQKTNRKGNKSRGCLCFGASRARAGTQGTADAGTQYEEPPPVTEAWSSGKLGLGKSETGGSGRRMRRMERAAGDGDSGKTLDV